MSAQEQASQAAPQAAGGADRPVWLTAMGPWMRLAASQAEAGMAASQSVARIWLQQHRHAVDAARAAARRQSAALLDMTSETLKALTQATEASAPALRAAQVEAKAAGQEFLTAQQAAMRAISQGGADAGGPKAP